MHTIAPINLHSSHKVLRSAPVHPTKTTFATLVSRPHWTERDLGQAHFYGKLSVCPLGIPHTKTWTKFEISSSSSFADIDAATVDMTLNHL